MSKTEFICILGDDFGMDCSWNPNQPFQIILDLASLFPYTTSNVVTWWEYREHLHLIPVDVSYAALQAHEIVNVALHREYSPGIVFIFSHGRKYLYHV
jgi:hypothetical protein